MNFSAKPINGDCPLMTEVATAPLVRALAGRGLSPFMGGWHSL
jgi:hypothetical protein